MVTAPHHLAAQAGANILRQGGNAVEAVVAAAAAIAVVYPHMNSIGGDGFWLISEPGKSPLAIQACGPAARLATPALYRERGQEEVPTRGPLAALTVAGAVGGWQKALQAVPSRSNAVPLAELLSEAIRYAREGVPICRSQQDLTKAKYRELRQVPLFTDTYASGGLPATGDLLCQPELAATLERLASSGLDDFYRGDLADVMAKGLSELGSPLRREDLHSYEAAIVKPFSVQLSDSKVYNLPPPTQGVSSLLILAIFEQLGVKQAETFEHVHGLVEATKHAFLLRNEYVTDPRRMSLDCSGWLTPRSVESLASRIDASQAMAWPHVAEKGDTVWIGAADSGGRVVSYIQSTYWEFGSGVVVPGTGVLWQNRGASFTLGAGPRQLGPGRLPFHTLNPALATFRDGRVLAYGTMGGEGQPQTQAAIFSRYAFFDSDLQAAITAPRWLLGRTWGDDATNLKLESRFQQNLVEGLTEAGHDVEVVEAYDDLMGHAGAVVHHPDGLIEGATDPRADGGCAGF